MLSAPVDIVGLTPDHTFDVNHKMSYCSLSHNRHIPSSSLSKSEVIAAIVDKPPRALKLKAAMLRFLNSLRQESIPPVQ
jgi:hypothetical protein